MEKEFMSKAKGMSRRQFVSRAAGVAAISSLAPRSVFAATRTESSGSAVSALPDEPTWKDQGVENLTKSPHAKLCDIPVHAVIIQSGFWGRRREINVTKSIP